MSTTYSIGAMNQLGDALEQAGFSAEDVTKLKQSDLKKIKFVLCGQAEIKMVEYLIDCDADPFIPEGWSVEKHQKGGQFKFNLDNISLYLSEKQKKESIMGDSLRKELANKSVLNANVLDYLLAHPKIIPEEWKGKYIFFWGTIYRDSRNYISVRCLDWRGYEWSWNCLCWHDFNFSPRDPAAITE